MMKKLFLTSPLLLLLFFSGCDDEPTMVTRLERNVRFVVDSVDNTYPAYIQYSCGVKYQAISDTTIPFTKEIIAKQGDDFIFVAHALTDKYISFRCAVYANDSCIVRTNTKYSYISFDGKIP